MFAILFLGIVAAVLLAAALGVLVFIGAAFRGEAPETASHHPPDNLSPSSKRRCCNRLMRRQYHSPLVPVTPRLFVAAVRRGCSSRPHFQEAGSLADRRVPRVVGHPVRGWSASGLTPPIDVRPACLTSRCDFF